VAFVILKRVVSGIVLLFATSLLAHVLVLPGVDNIARNILGESATPEQVTAKTSELGLDKPFLTRYWDWLEAAATGDLGSSYYTQQSVTDALVYRLPVTMSLITLVMLCTGLIAFTVGILAAVRKGWVDRALQVLLTAADALPAFLIALFLVTLLAVQLGWFPATGYVQPASSPLGWLASLTLPVAALTVSGLVGVAQHVRSAARTVLCSDYVRTRRSRGLSETYVVFTSVVRNSATPGLASLAVQITAVLGGAVVIEQIFALPGLGFLAVQSALRSDVPVTIGVLMTFVVIVVVVNLLVDVAVAWINPKVRLNV
jgi:peptide/nickel transport system permease protein